MRFGWLAALALACAPAFAQTGSIAGTIFNAANGQPVRQATVSVKGNDSLSAVTGLDGGFKLDLPEGSYTLVIKSANFMDTTVEGVEVKAGSITESSAVLSPQGASTVVDVVEKVGSVAASAEAALAKARAEGASSENVSNAARLLELTREITGLEAEIERLYARWAELERTS